VGLAHAAAPMGALLAGFGAFALLEFVSLGSGRDRAARGGDDELALWQLLIAGEVVVWVLLATVGFRALAELRASLPDARPASRLRWWRDAAGFLLLVYGAIVLLLVGGWIAGLASPTVLQGQQWKNVVLHAVGGVAISPFLVVLKRIQVCATDDAAWTGTARDVELVQLLRRHLRSATICLGAMVALAVLATGALRTAVVAAQLRPPPETFVLLYGGWFTGILAGIYLYVFGALEERARRIVERAASYGNQDLGARQDDDTSGQLRRSLSEELELGGDPRKNLEGLVAVFSPLIGALLSRLGGL
jgi:hypothetical protein